MADVKSTVDDHLCDWNDIQDEFQRPEGGILLGNGANAEKGTLLNMDVGWVNWAINFPGA